MTELADPGHAGYWQEIRLIWKLAEFTPGLPVPTISATRAVFDYRRTVHAADTAEAVALAETLLGYALNLTFAPRMAMAGDDTERYILEGFLPSGLAVDIVARAEHMAARRVPQPRTEPAVAA